MSISINVNRSVTEFPQEQTNSYAVGNARKISETDMKIAAKRKSAGAQAMKLISDAWTKDKESMNGIGELREHINRNLEDVSELSGRLDYISKEKEAVREKYGIDQDSQEQKDLELLEKYLLRQNKDKGHGLLKLAAVYISEKHFEDCFRTLDRIAFDKLTPSDQNKYFELLLYGRLMSGDISQANEIFVSAEHYFKRGLLDKRNGQMLFTLGLLEYFNERFEAAVKFFDSAEKSRDADKTLRCNCELYKGECFLAQGDVRSAKASAEKSAALVSDDKQEAQLGKLMTQVEKAYIRTKEKSADTKADNTTEGGYAF